MVITYHPDFALEPPYSLPCSARPQHTLFDTHTVKGFRVSGFLPCVL